MQLMNNFVSVTIRLMPTYVMCYWQLKLKLRAQSKSDYSFVTAMDPSNPTKACISIPCWVHWTSVDKFWLTITFLTWHQSESTLFQQHSSLLPQLITIPWHPILDKKGLHQLCCITRRTQPISTSWHHSKESRIQQVTTTGRGMLSMRMGILWMNFSQSITDHLRRISG